MRDNIFRPEQPNFFWTKIILATLFCTGFAIVTANYQWHKLNQIPVEKSGYPICITKPMAGAPIFGNLPPCGPDSLGFVDEEGEFHFNPGVTDEQKRETIQKLLRQAWPLQHSSSVRCRGCEEDDWL